MFQTIMTCLEHFLKKHSELTQGAAVDFLGFTLTQ